MLSFFKPKEQGSTSKEDNQSDDATTTPNNQSHFESQRVETNVDSIERDPGLRIPISRYSVNQMDEIKRAYIRLGPYQPILPEYPPTVSGAQNRRFQSSWLKQFSCWKRVKDGERCAFLVHVGGSNSPHNNVVDSIDDLMNVTRHIDIVMGVQTLEDVQKHRLRLRTIIENIKWLSFQACALRGHDESQSSSNRGNLIELIKLLGRMNEKIDGVTLENAPRDAKYVAPSIQKDILHIFGNKVRAKIREEIGSAKFCILVDEAKDVSNKEQMAIVLRFVDVSDFLQERFFDIVHVADTTAVSLKKEISKVLARHNLHIGDMRGQGYDGASNMRGSWNGLQALFLRDSPYAYHVHCFAHRLQLALVGAAEKEMSIWLFFSKLNSIVNLVGASPKRDTELHSAQAIEIAHMLATGECTTGKGANQIGTLHRAGKTRWSSHFDSICSLIDMYGAVVTVLGHIMDEGSSNSIRGEACGCLTAIRSFDFVFILHLMQKIMGITNLLCQALQKKSLDILSAMDLVKSTKALLQLLRENGYDVILTSVKSVCEKHDIDIPNMNDFYKAIRGRQQKDQVTVEHHYRFDVFHATIDFQMEELNNRFNDEAVELLKLSSALEPKENFKSFDIGCICSLAEKFYPADFSEQEMHYLRSQLEHYKLDVIHHEKFQNTSTISELCQKLSETNKAQDYGLIDRLIGLILTLPVSTATTERAFSAMKHVKSVL